MRQPDIARDDTRERLLSAALDHFAARGFHGASIAQIAGDLDLTKQALLYYFKRKDDLYREVIKRIAQRLQNTVRSALENGDGPETRFEEMFVAIYRAAMAHPNDTRVLMRELLDTQRSEAPEEEWYFKTFLDEIVRMLDQVDGMADLSFAHKLAGVYAILSAIEYFAASGPTLRRFYGDERYAEVEKEYADELRKQVRRLLGNGTLA